MALFVWANCVLSGYIWFKTLLDVYHPLSSSINTAASQSLDPRGLYHAVQSAVLGSEVRTSTPRRRRSRREMTLESSEREELRSALKALVVWLILKGLEPVSDNTLGWIIPLYAMGKTIILLVFVRFRVQLALHLFRTFVEPLGRPNEPLVDAGALNSVLFPAARFLLSLPLAHLTYTIRDRLGPSLTSFFSGGNSSAGEGAALEALAMSQDTPEQIRVKPPSRSRPRVSNGGSKSPSDRDVPGSRGRGDIGRGASTGTLSHQSSANSLRRSAKDSASSTTTDRMTPTTKAAASLLASLPPAPRDLPIRADAGPSPPPFRIDSPSSMSASTSASTLPRNYAFIPPPTSAASNGRNEQVPAPSPPDFFSPKMPGFLFGQTNTPGDHLTGPSPRPRFPLASLGVAPLTAQNGHGHGDLPQQRAFSSSAAAAPASTERASTGKRKAKDEDGESYQEEHASSEDTELVGERGIVSRNTTTTAPTKAKRSPRKKLKPATKEASEGEEAIATATSTTKSEGRVKNAGQEKGKTKEASQTTAKNKSAAATSQGSSKQTKTTMTRSRSTATVPASTSTTATTTRRAATKKAK
ncbi:hypothetical protein FA10DRAFT_264895 [Acaromyces ingoldii]|uniref:Proteophosphoglycan ppg4 n=1 Tax=Acaromyces ingoldii TaxID=215250 RepID=A0A316YZ74_9BASI|nr:hypothetical protein FA10DRAFT_264895 [Acaromyces ingoldii]PWN94356.1 hypothetical protein FA10DRAFT_264895 [Acaromyces ingoldii]